MVTLVVSEVYGDTEKRVMDMTALKLRALLFATVDCSGLRNSVRTEIPFRVKYLLSSGF